MFNFKKASLLFQDILWPIKRSELNLFVPMAMLMLCILFNFSTLRSIKDGLVVSSIGAEVISFIKLWFVLPCAVIFTIIYIRISNILPIDVIFNILISAFLLFFLFFAFYLYPNQEYYHPSKEFIEDSVLKYPHLKWFIMIAANWSYVAMYICSELWSVVVINLMFWQFANHVIDTSHAKRFYPMFGLIGNMGMIIAGNLIVFCTNLGDYHYIIGDLVGCSSNFDSEVGLKLMTMSITVSGLIAIFLFRHINKLIYNKEKAEDLQINEPKSTKTKLSFAESIKLIISSKYIGYIVIMIMCYGLVINMLEGPWKAKIKELYPTELEYMNFMGQFNIYMGIFSVIFMILGSNLVRKCSWQVSALITPTIIGVSGVIFFSFVIFPNHFCQNEYYMAFNPLFAAVIIGAIQNILSKSTKYSLFDSTKEMSYIPLSKELRTKGKAAAEVIGAKLGKSLGAFIQFSIFTFDPNATFDSMAPTLLAFFVVIIIIWLINIQKLNKEYLKMNNKKTETK